MIEDNYIKIIEHQKEIKKHSKEINRQLRTEYKRAFKIFGWVVVLTIILNLGALLMTNALVIKAQPDKTFTEVNPVTAETHELEPATSTYPKYIVFGTLLAFLTTTIAYAAIIGLYFNTKFRSFSRKQVRYNLAALLFISAAISLDFVNDFGYLIGKLIWGGL
jgi:ABC-type multidrug transport system permease subunit